MRWLDDVEWSEENGEKMEREDREQWRLAVEEAKAYPGL
jgi:hypothetical protein